MTKKNFEKNLEKALARKEKLARKIALLGEATTGDERKRRVSDLLQEWKLSMSVIDLEIGILRRVLDIKES